MTLSQLPLHHTARQLTAGPVTGQVLENENYARELSFYQPQVGSASLSSERYEEVQYIEEEYVDDETYGQVPLYRLSSGDHVHASEIQFGRPSAYTHPGQERNSTEEQAFWNVEF